MVKRHLYRSKHPFDAYAFEAMCCGSWQAVTKLRIRSGTLTFHLVDNQYMVLENGPYSDIRIRSRPATLSDCTCFLRPGVDICVLSDFQRTENLDGRDSQPVWIDAKISSIERKSHESRCSCQFYVNFYIKQKPLGSERTTLSEENGVIGIDQISILQKLQKNYCEGQYYRWDFSEDCSSLPKTKLLLGKFLSDLSWLIVTSVLKDIKFDVRSEKNKIVYQILGDDLDDYLNAVNFKVDEGILIPVTHKVIPADTIEAGLTYDICDTEPSPFSDLMDLRRSKRRNVQPDRFLGCDKIDEADIDYGKNLPLRIDQWEEEEEMTLPLSCLFGTNAVGPEEHTEREIKIHSSKPSMYANLLVHKKNTKGKEVRESEDFEKEDKNQLAIVPVPEENDLIAFEHYTNQISETSSSRYSYVSQHYTNQISETSSSRYYYVNNTRRVRRKNGCDLEDMEFVNKWDRTGSNSKVQRIRYHSSVLSKGDDPSGERTYKKRSLSAGAYKDLINSFLKNIDTTKKEEPQVIDQWKKFKDTRCLDQRIDMELEPPQNEDEGESSENEMLWREMELSLASTYLGEDNEGSYNGASDDIMGESSEFCQHEYKLDEEIGILCRICGFVSVEIKDVAPPFMQNNTWSMEDKLFTGTDTEQPDHDEDFDLLRSHASIDAPSSEEHDNAWDLIPELKRKLHLHQQKAFEFLWKNIAGSMVPALMKKSSKKIGGCVVSHSPGAGKSFLIIAFLVSYLKLFPGKRPLILAPKTTLYTWYKEFIKWEIPVPVYLIHGRRTYRVFRPKYVSFPGVPRPTDDVMHILDCLEKIQKWHSHPSVLVMGYTSFLTLMREDSKFAHRNYMAKVLRISPGILILDEGHNPRSTKSRLRKGLMKVETDLRILLSGTLFQNNFCEYFNTLCLARPKFVNEVLKALDPKYKRKRWVKKAWNLQENRARKFFLDHIARKIDSGVTEERIEGLNMLRKMTNRFIDVYEGCGGSDSLPGLQIYTLLMNTPNIQQDILNRLHRIMSQYPGYPLELELLITLGSIHPWLITTAVCANKFFSQKELADLEKYKFALKKGSKVRFVLSLVYRVVKREKILIFCHNIAPVKLFVELFENVFGWKKGKEVLVLTGDLELFERGKVMDRFEELSGPSRVLLASITACAEGISLTAASRVILLDSEWNPSKTKQAIARAFRPGQQKVVYVYQLLATGTLEEDKYRRTTWKEWVSSMIFSEAFVEDPSRWQAEKIEDDVLREMVEEDKVKSFHMIMKNEKASTLIRELKE